MVVGVISYSYFLRRQIAVAERSPGGGLLQTGNCCQVHRKDITKDITKDIL